MSDITIKKIGVTKLDVDAVVNAANSGLWEGGGVCGAIFSEAGSKELTAACSKYGHCDVGSAVITPGFKLKAKYIIHAVGPQWKDGNHGEPSQLYDAYKSSLELAKEHNCHSIGFPLISSGIFSYPKDGAWREAISACANFMMKNPDYQMDITFAVLNDDVLAMGEEIMADIVKETGVEIGPIKAGDSNADIFELSADLDKKAELFFRENLNLLKAIERDEELKRWFTDYSAYAPTVGHEGLLSVIMDEMFNRAYKDGIVISNYRDVIERTGIDQSRIWKPTKEWAASLNKIQIIACVAYHYRADHFNDGSLISTSIGKGLLIPFFEAYIEKCK